jgi:hypothetical protein
MFHGPIPLCTQRLQADPPASGLPWRPHQDVHHRDAVPQRGLRRGNAEHPGVRSPVRRCALRAPARQLAVRAPQRQLPLGATGCQHTTAFGGLAGNATTRRRGVVLRAVGCGAGAFVRLAATRSWLGKDATARAASHDAAWARDACQTPTTTTTTTTIAATVTKCVWVRVPCVLDCAQRQGHQEPAHAEPENDQAGADQGVLHGDRALAGRAAGAQSPPPMFAQQSPAHTRVRTLPHARSNGTHTRPQHAHTRRCP